MQYKAKINPFNGMLQLVPTNIVLSFKEGVDEQADLPLSGNAVGDARIANDTGHLYVWSIESSSGLLTDWIDAGDIVDLNWSAIAGKPSSAVADIDDAVTKRHSPESDNQVADTVPTEDSGVSVQDALNALEGVSHTQDTDKYLTTMVTNVLYVDNKRTDDYTPTGTITKPFKTIQSAHDAITGNSSTNRFEIRIATGAYYSEVLALSKDQIVLVGEGGLARLTGAITITSLHLRFENLRINSNVTLSLPTGFLLECDGCQTTTGTWNITATAPVGNEFVQILRSRLWSSQINTTGIKGIVGFSGGILQGAIFNITNSEFQMANVDADTFTLNLKTGTHAELGGSLVQRSTLNIDATSDAQADATWLGTNTLINAGTLTLMTKGGDIRNIPAGNISSTDVQSAINELDTDKVDKVTGSSLVPDTEISKIHSPESDNQTADTVPTEDSGISVQDALNALKESPGGILKVETYTQDKLFPSAEMIINHSAPTTSHHIISEIYGLQSEVDESLDFDTVDEGNYTQENIAKTDFIDDKVQLHLDEVISNVYAHYHLNELSQGVVEDSSGNDRDGFTIANPIIIDGKLNKAKNFIPANDQYINLGNIASFDYNTVFSIEAWIRTTNGDGNYHSICSKFDVANSKGYIFGVYGGGIDLAFQSSFEGGFLEVWSTPINDGNWHHVLVNYDGTGIASGITIYVDNVDATAGTWDNGVPLTSLTHGTFCSIGSCDGSSIMDGDIDEVVIYKDFNLNETQRTFRYNAGAGRENMGTYDTTKGWYVRTNTNQINTSTWSGILQLEPIDTLPIGTQIRYLVSIDNKVTWKKFNGSIWTTVDLVDIDTQGNTSEELSAMVKDDWDLLFVAGTLDIVASLKSTISTSTPLLNLIGIHYNAGLIMKLVDSKVLVTRVSPTQHKIKNILTEPLYGVSITMIIP